MHPPHAEPVLTVAQMRAAEDAAIASGVSARELMDRAGEGAAQWIWRMAAGRPVTVLCGPGNNGGDGYVIAEWFRRRGTDVAVIAPMEPGTDEAKAARDAFDAPVATEAGERTGGVFVEALFGVGLSCPLSDDLAATIERLRAVHDQTVAIDVPSNIDSDSGECLGPVAQCDLTLALGARKRAHALMPARAFMGDVRCVGIGLDLADAGRGGRTLARPVLAGPGPTSHKYTRGLLAIVGGAMAGAGLLASEAAMRAGAGYVKLLAPHSHPAAPAALVLEEGDVSRALEDSRIDALLVGPGLGRDDTARVRLAAALATGKPLVLDADALALLGPSDLTGRTAPLIVTPHEGELATLEKAFGLAGDGSKPERAQALARALSGIVVAKGPDTVIAFGTDLVFALPASPWLSTAGTGDVLAGVIASRLAHHGDGLRAAEEGVAIHSHGARTLGAAFTADELALAIGRSVAALS
ncbi:NAD(P)H-hydrate dehydratase [Qipengyuania sp. JC766]|uniref:NAD(P)H-hydrate dehydratase n=2 Tax=Pseudomonadati TaxID=3379134 RepID=UPI003459E446